MSPDTITNLLFWGGLAITVVGWLWLLGYAFEESPFWGMAVMFLPFVAYIFILKDLGKCWKPGVIWVIGTSLLWTGWDYGVGVKKFSEKVEQTVPRVPVKGIQPAHETATRTHQEMVGQNFVGTRTINIQKTYGLPTHTEHTREGIIYTYGDLELISTDGGWSITRQRSKTDGTNLPDIVNQQSEDSQGSEASSVQPSQAPAPQPFLQPTAPANIPNTGASSDFVGKTIDEVEGILGTATSKIELGDTIVYQYGNWEITSEDGGKTVSKQKNTKKESGSDY